MKQSLKKIARVVATMLVSPVGVAYLLGCSVVGTGRVFPGCSQLLSLAPGVTGQFLRLAFYRIVLPGCGKDACVGFGAQFSHATAEIGDGVYIGPGSMIGDATLEDDVLVSSHVSIINGAKQHAIDRLDIPVREQPGVYPRITIGRDSWIGERAVVMADVGRHAVVGAGAVVTKPVPDYAIVVGNPARQVGLRRADDPVPSPADTVAGANV